jgi:hypothetical protein
MAEKAEFEVFMHQLLLQEGPSENEGKGAKGNNIRPEDK